MCNFLGRLDCYETVVRASLRMTSIHVHASQALEPCSVFMFHMISVALSETRATSFVLLRTTLSSYFITSSHAFLYHIIPYHITSHRITSHRIIIVSQHNLFSSASYLFCIFSLLHLFSSASYYHSTIFSLLHLISLKALATNAESLHVERPYSSLLVHVWNVCGRCAVLAFNRNIG